MKEWFEKYRWFYTSSGNLVVGGKNAEQNDSLLKEMKKSGEEYLVMHTESPGSPFSIIIANIEKISSKEKHETAIFTACFSRAWRENMHSVPVHIFKLSQLNKSKIMKSGTWAVKGKVEKVSIPKLELALVKQNSKLRAVPISTPKKQDIIIIINPSKKSKEESAKKISSNKKIKLSYQEIIESLPSGGSEEQ